MFLTFKRYEQPVLLSRPYLSNGTKDILINWLNTALGLFIFYVYPEPLGCKVFQRPPLQLELKRKSQFYSQYHVNNSSSVKAPLTKDHATKKASNLHKSLELWTPLCFWYRTISRSRASPRLFLTQNYGDLVQAGSRNQGRAFNSPVFNLLLTLFHLPTLSALCLVSCES